MELASSARREDLTAIVAERFPHARELVALAACDDPEALALWLDDSGGIIVFAAAMAGPGGSWRVEWAQVTIAAVVLLEEAAGDALRRLADPRLYGQVGDAALVERDLQALAELQAVQLVVLRSACRPDPIEPAASGPAVDRAILARMDQLRAELGRLGALRAHALAAAYGSERGAVARAAKALGITHAVATRAFRGGRHYAERIRSGAEKARLSDSADSISPGGDEHGGGEVADGDG